MAAARWISAQSCQSRSSLVGLAAVELAGMCPTNSPTRTPTMTGRLLTKGKHGHTQSGRTAQAIAQQSARLAVKRRGSLQRFSLFLLYKPATATFMYVHVPVNAFVRAVQQHQQHQQRQSPEQDPEHG